MCEFQFALPRGERLKMVMVFGGRSMFQFALPRGERRQHDAPYFALPMFQFALPRGERHIEPTRTPSAAGFNSRSRVGSDDCAQTRNTDQSVSIRAPAWGATAITG